MKMGCEDTLNIPLHLFRCPDVRSRPYDIWREHFDISHAWSPLWAPLQCVLKPHECGLGLRGAGITSPSWEALLGKAALCLLMTVS